VKIRIDDDTIRYVGPDRAMAAHKVRIFEFGVSFWC
jgi:hypothetical protein